MEETHNTLKFASRAKRVEIYASRNRIIDEKSLIKKYQREIAILKQELDHFKKGMLTGVNQEEIMSLRQQLEEGQVKMQSRLEEEEEAKAALMSRIQRLTKLILVSSKNSIPGCLTDLPGHQHRRSLGEDDKLEVLRESSPQPLEGENTLKDSLSSAPSDLFDSLSDVKHQWSSSKLNDEHSSVGSSVTESNQTGMTASDEMDLFVEQVKMLAGEIAFSTSTLKRLVEQSVNDPDGSKMQIQNLEREIQEKRRQMRVLEQRIIESGEASMSNASLVDMQQTVMKLMAQCNEKGFELELKTADNRILQEQLQEKCSENKELQEKVLVLQQQLASAKMDQSPEQCVSEEISDLKSKLQSQEAENEKLNIERHQLIEENHQLLSQNQKLVEEALYAKELASSAAVELKNLAEEVTRLSLENARLGKELLVAQDMAYSRAGGGASRKFSESRAEGANLGRRGRPASRGGEVGSTVHGDVECCSLDMDDMKMQLQTMKQREASLEAALAEKELLEQEYKRKFDEAKKREMTLENDLAGMWVLVAKLKKEASGISELNVDKSFSNGVDLTSNEKEDNNEYRYSLFKERQTSDMLEKPIDEQVNQSPEFEPLLVRLKARIQEMKEKEVDPIGNGDANSHVCKVCFESPTAAVLLPCRHFCLCKPCSLACSECPLCRTKIADRIITFTS
ncbi:putative Kinesin-like protein KIN-7K, chloroplastic [Cocos nucifera]|nr:putative Kinesin-like protein KIN-7K, chloroplastic [Cocos nucifera]